ncbi:MAG: guanylate kinase [Candidatus Accumulibacter sp.]|jgi:guanylate kinase|nr:guanylate kinase [Accumulibacter sp.]
MEKPSEKCVTETSGHLYIISAPSGAGKTTLVRMLLEGDPNIHLSVSCTTRAPRKGEAYGREYCFTSEADFLERAGRGEFLEWAKVHKHYYGTSKSWIDIENGAGHDVLLEIDWQGARQVRKIFPDAIGIFILPPSIETLRERLIGRGTDTESEIGLRIEAARDEMRHVGEFDYVIINADLPRAFREISTIIDASRLQYATQRQRHARLFSALL